MAPDGSYGARMTNSATNSNTSSKEGERMDEIEWDTTCVLCDGNGTLSHGSGDEEQETACISCEGYGYNPTDAGHELIAFLRRRGLAFPMSPIAEDELRGIVEK